MPDLAPQEIDYAQLHQFRYLIRRFLRFSEEAARAAGVEPQQHQLLLAIKGMQPSPDGISVTVAAERLQISHNTTVELVNRAQAAGLVVRSRSEKDRRLVRVRLTPRGEDCLRRLSDAHLAELRSWAPELIGALSALLGAIAESTDHEFQHRIIPARRPSTISYSDELSHDE